MNSGWRLVLLSNALGPNPSGVAVSPNECQSLQVTWTHHPPHISSNSLLIEVLGTRWFPTDCHHNISGFLYTHWTCSCHNVHSQSGRTNPTWIWGLLLWTRSYNWQWWDILWCMHGVIRWLWHLDKYYVTATFLVYSTYVFHLCWCMTVCLQPTGLVFGRVKITAFTRLQV